LTLLQLRYLLAIADNGLNITAAANHLYTSQPGVCKQLKLLEEELGLQLFTRHGKRLSAITTAGDQIIIHARLIMREVEGIRSLTRALINEVRGNRDLLVNDSPQVAAMSQTEPMRHKSMTATPGRPLGRDKKRRA
jgi:DNA-binding transcriptional LysR family regulator